MNAMTAATLDKIIPKEIWNKSIFWTALAKEFWGTFKGGVGSGKPIIEKEDLTKFPGEYLYIPLLSMPLGARVTGENALESKEGVMGFGSIKVKVDVQRNGMAITNKARLLTPVDMANAMRKGMADLLAVDLSDLIFYTILTGTGLGPGGASPSNVIFASDKADVDALDASCVMKLDDLDFIRFKLQEQGAAPIATKRVDGRFHEYYAIVLSDIDAYHLKTDPDYRKYMSEILPGEKNPLLTGAMKIWNGLLIYEHRALAGIVGTALRADSKLADDIDIGATEIPLVVAADNNNNYTRYFAEPDATGALTNIMIDPGGSNQEIVGLDTAVAKTNNVLTAAAGEVDNAHSAGERVVQANSTVPISTALGFGAEMVIRAWAEHPRRIENNKDYSFKNGIGYEMCIGHSATENTEGTYPNFVIMKTYGWRKAL